jgi:hypothetical protein
MPVIKRQEERLVLICDCHDVEHQIHFTYDPEEHEEGYDVIYVETHLTKLSFFKRLSYGIKYIFGYRSKYGAFSEIVLHPDDVEKMSKIKKGVPLTKEHRKALCGVVRGMSGKKHSEESKRKISEARKGIVFSDDHKKNISKGLQGNINKKGKVKCK